MMDESDLQLSCCETLESIEMLKQEWQQLHQQCTYPSIYNSYDFIYTAIKYFCTPSDEIFVIAIRNNRQNGQLVGVFPFLISDYQWHHAKFRAVVYAGLNEADKMYPIILKDVEKSAWPKLFQFLKLQKKRWQFFELVEVRKDFHARKAIKKYFPSGYLKKRNEDVYSPIVDLTETWEVFWNKHRKMRKRVRKMENDFGEAFSFKVYAEPEAAMTHLDEYIQLEQRSWKASEKVGISKSQNNLEFYREFFAQLAEKNRLYFGFLYQGERLVSAEIAYTLGHTVYFSHGCYDLEFRHYSPGMVSTSLFLKNFFNVGYKNGDFLGGFAYYINPWAKTLLSSDNLIVAKITPTIVLVYLASLLKRITWTPMLSLLKKTKHKLLINSQKLIDKNVKH
ncbi:GNAT family N-acetyltransferase [Aliikangiella maris]|uniref:GNAT family N-acetyltransferase n=2 Tax=Aliikangiella maris TaxID=3162458 RepID=A0ABV3MNG0_9GAMM